MGAVLIACCLGCSSSLVGNDDVGPVVDRNGGHGGQGVGAPGGTGGSAGACVISCGQEACPVRDGEPRVLVTSPRDQQIMALAVNADTLFWGTYPSETPGEIRSMPLAGGPSTLIAGNVVVTGLYLDGSTLYYATTDRMGSSSLVAIPASGGTSRVIATGSTIGLITSNASSIFFAQGNAIMRTDRAGSAATVVAGAGPNQTLWGFAVDETDVYWAAYSNGGGLYRRALTGGDTSTMRTSSGPITYPITDGDDIDYVEGLSTPATCQSAIWSISKAGGPM